MSAGLVFIVLLGLLGDVITRKYNKYILKASTILIITIGLMHMTKEIRVLLIKNTIKTTADLAMVSKVCCLLSEKICSEENMIAAFSER